MIGLVQYEYEGNLISFEIDEEIMVNATQMAKVFVKNIHDFLRLKQTKEYIYALGMKFASEKGIPFSSENEQARVIEKYILKSLKGGKGKKYNQGTWMHQELALKFAAWLDVNFELWVFQQIKTLLKTGSVSISQNQIAFTNEQKRYLEQTFATKQDLKELSEFLINEHDWNQGVTIIEDFMLYVGKMLRQLESNQATQETLLSHIDNSLDIFSLEVDILKQAVRTILEKDNILVGEEIVYVYLFLEEHTNYYKIGHSKDPVTRKDQFRLWKDLVLVHKIEVSSLAVAVLIEKLLHHIFKNKSLEREWFQLLKEDVVFFCSL